MVNVHHIQYPVGQGGLHLGIIGSYAYIYDCGGYGKNVDWNNIFDDVIEKLEHADCKNLDIFISHWHQDHCNKLEDFFAYWREDNHKKPNINIYIPPLSDIEKIILLCEYFASDIREYDKDYVYLVLNQKFRTLEDTTEIHYKKNFSLPKRIENTDIILSTYITGIPAQDNNVVESFRNNLKLRHISLSQAIRYDKWKDTDFVDKVKEAFINTFNTKRITNHIMLCLYCGFKYTHPYLHNKKVFNNWLHLGDACLKELAQFSDFVKKFDALLYNVNFAQIPHHSSSSNHNCVFSFLFNPYCKFYYTSQDKPAKASKFVKPYSCDIDAFTFYPSIQVSENPLTKLEI